MKTTIKDYILLIMLGVLFGISLWMSFNVINNIDTKQSMSYLIATVFLMICVSFIKIGRTNRRANPARYDREFYNSNKIKLH